MEARYLRKMTSTQEYDFKIATNEEILAAAAKVRVADPAQNPGDFARMDGITAHVLFRLISMSIKSNWTQSVRWKDARKGSTCLVGFSTVRILSCRSDVMSTALHIACINFFHGKKFEGEGDINPDALPSWPGWKDSHRIPGLRERGGIQLDGMNPRDADQLNSWVYVSIFQLQTYDSN
jgi:hypothetical protein